MLTIFMVDFRDVSWLMYVLDISANLSVKNLNFKNDFYNFILPHWFSSSNEPSLFCTFIVKRVLFVLNMRSALSVISKDKSRLLLFRLQPDSCVIPALVMGRVDSD